MRFPPGVAWPLSELLYKVTYLSTHVAIVQLNTKQTSEIEPMQYWFSQCGKPTALGTPPFFLKFVSHTMLAQLTSKINVYNLEEKKWKHSTKEEV